MRPTTTHMHEEIPFTGTRPFVRRKRHPMGIGPWTAEQRTTITTLEERIARLEALVPSEQLPPNEEHSEITHDIAPPPESGKAEAEEAEGAALQNFSESLAMFNATPGMIALAIEAPEASRPAILEIVVKDLPAQVRLAELRKLLKP